MKGIAFIIFILSSLTATAQNEDVVHGLTATEFNGKVLLTWAITQGNTCNGVEILHSTDSINFTQIGAIEGVCGSTQEKIEYDFTHLFPEKNAINYYRLSLGGIGFSYIVSVEVLDLGGSISIVRPNPIAEPSELLFDNETNAPMSLEVFSYDGVLQFTASTNGERFELYHSDFAPGIYMYSIIKDGIGTEIIGRFVVH